MRGSLQQIKNRRGELVWRVQWREHGSGRTRILGTCREMGRAEAKAALQAIVGPLEGYRAADRSGVSVAEFVRDDYLPDCSVDWKRSTESTTTALIERYIVARIGDQILATVTRKQLQGLLADLAADGLSASVVTHVRFQLQAIFRMAAADGRIAINPAPARGLKTPRSAKARVAPEIGDKDRVSRAIMSLDTRDRLFVQLAVWRGMRPGEIAALQIGDIYGGLIHVRRRVYMGVVDDSTKSENGVRDIDVGSLQDQIDLYIATLTDQRPEAWLFPSENGQTPVDPHGLYQRRLQPALEAAGLERPNYQSMRATWSTIGGKVEPDAKVRADVAGHRVDVQEQIYRRSTKEQRKAFIARFDKYVLQ